MRKSRELIQKDYRARQGESLKAKERKRGIEKRKTLTENQKEKTRQQARVRMRNMKLRKLLADDTTSKPLSLVTPFGSSASQTKAVQR
jgi:hypothetical protein